MCPPRPHHQRACQSFRKMRFFFFSFSLSLKMPKEMMPSKSAGSVSGDTHEIGKKCAVNCLIIRFERRRDDFRSDLIKMWTPNYKQSLFLLDVSVAAAAALAAIVAAVECGKCVRFLRYRRELKMFSHPLFSCSPSPSLIFTRRKT